MSKCKRIMQCMLGIVMMCGVSSRAPDANEQSHEPKTNEQGDKSSRGFLGTKYDQMSAWTNKELLPVTDLSHYGINKAYITCVKDLNENLNSHIKEIFSKYNPDSVSWTDEDRKEASKTFEASQVLNSFTDYIKKRFAFYKGYNYRNPSEQNRSEARRISKPFMNERGIIDAKYEQKNCRLELDLDAKITLHGKELTVRNYIIDDILQSWADLKSKELNVIKSMTYEQARSKMLNQILFSMRDKSNVQSLIWVYEFINAPSANDPERSAESLQPILFTDLLKCITNADQEANGPLLARYTEIINNLNSGKGKINNLTEKELLDFKAGIRLALNYLHNLKTNYPDIFKITYKLCEVLESKEATTNRKNTARRIMHTLISKHINHNSTEIIVCSREEIDKIEEFIKDNAQETIEINL